MKKNQMLWVVIKYCLFLFSLYTLVNLFTGEVKFSEIPSYVLSLVIRLFVSFFMISIIYFIIVKVFRIK